MSELSIIKAIFEVQYPASASLFDNRGKIASRWQGTSDLSEWKISNNQVAIHNKANTTYLRVGLRNALTIMEIPVSYDLFLEQAENFITTTLKTLNVVEIKRVGLRIIQIGMRRQFRSLVTNLRKSLFTLDSKDWNILGGTPDDIAFPLTLSIGDYRANFKIGPMRREQLARDYLESDIAKKQSPTAALCVDFDLYQIDIDWKQADFDTKLHNMLEDGYKKITTISESFVNRFGGFK